MVDAKGRDLQALVFEHHDGVALTHRGQGKRKAFAATAAGRHDFLGVVGYAVAKIEHIGSAKAIDDFVDPGGTEYRRGRLERAQPPALQQEGRQAVDVVGMEVRQQDGFDFCGRNAHVAEIARAAFSGVHDEEAVAGNDGRAGASTGRVGKWGAGAAQGQVQSVGQFREDVASHVLVGDLLQQISSCLPLEHPKDSRTQQRQGHQREQHGFESLHGPPNLHNGVGNTVPRVPRVG